MNPQSRKLLSGERAVIWSVGGRLASNHARQRQVNHASEISSFAASARKVVRVTPNCESSSWNFSNSFDVSAAMV